ncbi:MAG TPA: hypothetical protein VHQ45_20130 [Gemmatimonadaceae bacterium]|nr:hypothetical protein [Gemmatimonadaceae bacterium]
MIALVALVLQLQGAAAPVDGGVVQTPATEVQVGVTVQPDTVTVGDPFVVQVRLRAPLGAVITFPAGPDTTGPVQALDPRVVRASGDTLGVDQTATYRLAAWDVGRFPIPLGEAVVSVGGSERRVALRERFVVVRTVLPEDSAQRVPKPARAIYEWAGPWWLKWLLGLLAIGIVGLLLWWWWRRRRRPPIVEDPYALAEQQFARVEALGLLEAGERGRYVALMVDVLRDYLAIVVPAARPALTSTELLAALRAERTVPLDRLAPLLAETDLVKFARRAVHPTHALELGREARAIAWDVHEAILARQAAEQAAQQAKSASSASPPAERAA